MNREFQALVRHASPAKGQPSGQPFTVRHICESADQLAALLQAGGFCVLPGGITELWPAVDWSKPVFNRDEMAALLGKEPGTLTQIKSAGKLPFTEINGSVLYERAVVFAHLHRNANPLGKQILRELDTQPV